MTNPTPIADRIRAWADGDYGFQAAAEITLSTTIREQFVSYGGQPSRFVDVSAQYARPLWAELLTADKAGSAYLSGSAKFLVTLCENIAHGPADGPVDLRQLWSLDNQNRAHVLRALRENLRVGTNL